MDKESLYSRMGLQFFAEPGSGAEGGAGGTEGGQGGGTPKTFTQEQVNSMMATEKRSGRLALLKELGYEVKDGAKASDVIAQVKGILDSGKTQQQKDQEAREKAEGDLSAEQAKSKQLQAKIDAMTAGVKPDYVDDAIALLSPRVTDQKPLSKLLEESKEKYPNWFGEAEGSKGTGGSTNPPRGKGTDTEGLGKRLAQANKPAAKSSFFKN